MWLAYVCWYCYCVDMDFTYKSFISMEHERHTGRRAWRGGLWCETDQLFILSHWAIIEGMVTAYSDELPWPLRPICFTLSIRLYRLHHHYPKLEDVKTTLVSLIAYKASNELISLIINTRHEGLFCIIFYPVIFESVCNLTAATAECVVLLWTTR